MGSIRASFTLFDTFLFSVVFFIGILTSIGLDGAECFSFVSTLIVMGPAGLIRPGKVGPGLNVFPKNPVLGPAAVQNYFPQYSHAHQVHLLYG